MNISYRLSLIGRVWVIAPPHPFPHAPSQGSVMNKCCCFLIGGKSAGHLFPEGSSAWGGGGSAMQDLWRQS